MSEAQCTCDPGLKKSWGCEEPSQHAVWQDIDGEGFFSCPIKFIVPTVLYWYEEYRFYKEFGGTPPYHTLPNKWVEAYECYGHYLYQYAQMDKNRAAPDKMLPLKQTFQARSKK